MASCVPRSGDQERSLLYKPTKGAQVDQQVGEGKVGGGARQAIGPDAFQAKTCDLTVATLDGVFACAIVCLPERRAVGIEASQACVAGAIWMDEGAADVRDHTQGTVGVTERASSVVRPGRALQGADLAADPTGT